MTENNFVYHPHDDNKNSLSRLFRKIIKVIFVTLVIIVALALGLYFASRPQRSVKVAQEVWQKLDLEQFFDVKQVAQNHQDGSITLELDGHQFSYQCQKNRGLRINQPEYECEYQFDLPVENFATYVVALHAAEIATLADKYPDITWSYYRSGSRITYNSVDPEPLRQFLIELLRIPDMKALYQASMQIHDTLPPELSNDFYVIDVHVESQAVKSNGGTFTFGNHEFTTNRGIFLSFDLFLLYDQNQTYLEAWR